MISHYLKLFSSYHIFHRIRLWLAFLSCCKFQNRITCHRHLTFSDTLDKVSRFRQRVTFAFHDIYQAHIDIYLEYAHNLGKFSMFHRSISSEYPCRIHQPGTWILHFLLFNIYKTLLVKNHFLVLPLKYRFW